MSDHKFQIVKSKAVDKHFPIPLFFEGIPEHQFIRQLKESTIWFNETKRNKNIEVRSIVPDPHTPVVYSVLMTEGETADFILFRFYRHEQDGVQKWFASNDGKMTALGLISHLVMAMSKFYKQGHHDGAVSQFPVERVLNGPSCFPANFRMGEARYDVQIMTGADDLGQSAKELGKALAEVFPDPHQEEKLYPGYAPGEQCNREGCQGTIDEHESDLDGCRCHINPPCAYCTEERSFCPSCGWEASESSF